MRCPVCDQVAPRGANFCFACGTSLARICPRCQAGQSPDARFCPECGGRLPIGPGESPGEIPEDVTEAPPEPPVVEARDDPARPDDDPGDDDPGDDAAELEAERRRDSRRRLATAAGVLLLVLAALGGMAFWMRSPNRAPSLDRSAGRPPETSTPAGVTSAPATPSPAPNTPSQAPPRVAASGSEPTLPPERRAPDPSESRIAQPAEPSRPLAVEQPERRAVEPRERRPPAPAESRVEMPRPLPERRAAQPERWSMELPIVSRVPSERESPAALPGRGRGDVRIDVAAERAGGGITVYTVRLRERDGSPVSGAAVTIHGRRPGDGERVEAGMDPASEAGVYRAALRAGDVLGARLRVASAGRIQDLPLPD